MSWSASKRFSYEALLSSEGGARCEADMRRAHRLFTSGQPEAIVEAAVPLEMEVAARTYPDKCGPGSRYDSPAHAPNSPVPLLVTLGELESEGLAFRDLATRGPALHEASARVSYALIAGADHSYATRVPELWKTFRGWLSPAGIATAAVTM